MTRTIGDRLFAIGFLLQSAALLLKDDLFPETHRHGHWFWIGVIGAALALTGLTIRWLTRRQISRRPLTQP
jgi:hypothetical protein